MRWLVRVIIAIVLFAATFVVYMRVLDADFLMWDDNVQLVENQRLGGWSLERLVWAFTDVETASRYIPLTLVGWIATYEVWERDPFGYHLGNLLLHCGSVVAAFLLIESLLGTLNNSARQRTAPMWTLTCAAMGALLWGWHPMRTEVVAWAISRTFCQSTFFALVCLWLYVRRSDSAHPRAMYALALAAFAASVLSYPQALMLPGVLLVMDFFPLKRAQFRWDFWCDPRLRRCVIEKIPFALTAGLVLGLTLLARTHASAVYHSQAASLEDFGIVPRILQACYLSVYYLWRPWWPVNLTPVRTELVWFDAHLWLFVASAAAWAAITAGCAAVRRRWPAPLAIWLIHLTLLFPMLGLTEHPHYPADRYSILEGLLWPIVIVSALWTLGSAPAHRWLRAGGTSIVSAIIAMLALLTFRQTAIWHDSVSLFRYMLTVLGTDDPYRSDIHRKLGVFYATENPPDFAQAESELTVALQIVPRDERPRLMLAQLLSQQHKDSRAEALLRDGLVLNPDSTDLRLVLGQLLLLSRRPAAAIDQFSEVLRRDPANSAAKEGMATAGRMSR